MCLPHPQTGHRKSLRVKRDTPNQWFSNSFFLSHEMFPSEEILWRRQMKSTHKSDCSVWCFLVGQTPSLTLSVSLSFSLSYAHSAPLRMRKLQCSKQHDLIASKLPALKPGRFKYKQLKHGVLFKQPFLPYVVQKIEDPLFIPQRKSWLFSTITMAHSSC